MTIKRSYGIVLLFIMFSVAYSCEEDKKETAPCIDCSEGQLIDEFTSEPLLLDWSDEDKIYFPNGDIIADLHTFKVCEESILRQYLAIYGTISGEIFESCEEEDRYTYMKIHEFIEGGVCNQDIEKSKDGDLPLIGSWKYQSVNTGEKLIQVPCELKDYEIVFSKGNTHQIEMGLFLCSGPATITQDTIGISPKRICILIEDPNLRTVKGSEFSNAVGGVLFDNENPDHSVTYEIDNNFLTIKGENSGEIKLFRIP